MNIPFHNRVGRRGIAAILAATAAPGALALFLLGAGGPNPSGPRPTDANPANPAVAMAEPSADDQISQLRLDLDRARRDLDQERRAHDQTRALLADRTKEYESAIDRKAQAEASLARWTHAKITLNLYDDADFNGSVGRNGTWTYSSMIPLQEGAVISIPNFAFWKSDKGDNANDTTSSGKVTLSFGE